MSSFLNDHFEFSVLHKINHWIIRNSLSLLYCILTQRHTIDICINIAPTLKMLEDNTDEKLSNGTRQCCITKHSLYFTVLIYSEQALKQLLCWYDSMSHVKPDKY